MSDGRNSVVLGACPRIMTNQDVIQLGHGSGGLQTNELVAGLFVAAFDNPALNRQNDQAIFEVGGTRLAFSTDSYVVNPIFFPGGDIGELSVNGTVNDLCMSGARPLCLSAGFIIEEGFAMADLERVVASMQKAASAAGVLIVTGDTKVVDRGHGDSLFINTAGIGIVEHNFDISADRLRPGDRIIVSGSIGDHGVAILTARKELSFESLVESDTAALNTLVEQTLMAAGAGIHAMRDPTRGGIAAILNEFAQKSQVGITIFEDRIPVRPPVSAACELLGLDPLCVANEGKLVAVVEEAVADKVLAGMQGHELGRSASIIGEVTDERPGAVIIETGIGGWRFVEMPSGEQLPRIC